MSFIQFIKQQTGLESDYEKAEREAYEKERIKLAKKEGKKRAIQEIKKKD